MTEDPATRHTAADAFLRQTSWDGTWSRMRALVDDAVSGVGSDTGVADGRATG